MTVKGKRLLACLALAAGLILAAGCAAGPDPASGTGAATRTRAPSRTASLPPTVTPTATEIPTVVPVVTASPGPKPDLELVNVTILNDMPWDFVFMAEMVNNTDEPMIFNEREVGLVLTFERWWERAGDRHGYDQVNLRPIVGTIQSMNCILYPGEKGIVAFFSRSVEIISDNTMPGGGEVLSEPIQQQGTQLIGYQALFRPWKDLRQQYPFNEPVYGYPDELKNSYHPEAENFTYRLEGNRIIVEFDVNVQKPEYGGHYASSWMILYDKDENIINILQTVPLYCKGVGCFKNRMYHLFGIGSNSYVKDDPTVAPDVYTDYWKPLVEIDNEQLQLIDHIRVLNELQNYSMCIDPLS
jgi:hypothetical protein